MLKEKLPIFLINTLLLHIPLLALLTDGITERQIHWLRVGWRIFFSSCAVVSVFGSGEKYVLVLHTTTYVLTIEYNTVVVLC